MRAWMERRKARRLAKEALHSAQHVLNLREDVLPARAVDALRHEMARVAKTVNAGDAKAVHSAVCALHTELSLATPRRKDDQIRGWVEVIAVAITVALGFRTYFLQPFKIPTGSMQPTLYGVHSGPEFEGRTVFGVPLKGVREFLSPVGDDFAFLPILGARHIVVTAKAGGMVGMPHASEADPTALVVPVGNALYAIPRDARPFAMPGERMEPGTVLWRGWKTAGDHVLVNRMALNFGRPRRDQVMVFSTGDIAGLPPGTHYIKRLVGCPNETLSIQEPNLLVNGKPPRDSPGIKRTVEDRGYRLTRPEEQGLLDSPDKRLVLGPAQYAGFGDNTGNSRDSRYWGVIPERNLIGPAVFVYWPFNERWGLIR